MRNLNEYVVLALTSPYTKFKIYSLASAFTLEIIDDRFLYD
jgi:hypothetical protein